jgi:hypothetical protein
MSNVGNLDRLVRLLAGIASIASSALLGWQSPWTIPVVLVGLVLVTTSAIGFCPLYALLGLSSKRPPAASK